MKSWIVVGIIIIASSCAAESEFFDFGKLRIPRSYILQAPSGGKQRAFDEDRSIALIFDENEVKAAVPQYQIEARGSTELSFLVHQEQLDLETMSTSLLSNFGGDGQVGPDKYSPNSRIYRSSNGWAVVSDEGGRKKLQALCRLSGLANDIEVCDFDKNIGGYGVTYHLENNNISLSKEFEGFILMKLESWSIAEQK